jgi:RNA polymerase sigma factor (sigma-70 family)
MFEAIVTKVLLQRYLDSSDANKAQRLLEDLVCNHAMPIIRRVIARKSMDEQEKESIYGLAMAQLIEWLTALRGSPRGEEIRDFAAYVRRIARRAFGDFLDEKRPERRRLKARIRFFLKNQDLLAVWHDSEFETVCGLKQWRERGVRPARSDRRDRLEEDPDEAAHAAVKEGHPRNCKLGPLLGYLLLWVGHPVEIEVLTNAVAQIQGLNEPQRVTAPVGDDEEGVPDAYAQLADDSIDLEGQMQMRAHLELIWKAVSTLTVKQRRVLLLSLEDTKGGSALLLFPAMRIAFQEDIARSLEMPIEEFVKLWRELPLQDIKIAEMLGIKPGNVRFQRSDARSRLQSQIRAYEN